MKGKIREIKQFQVEDEKHVCLECFWEYAARIRVRESERDKDSIYSANTLFL